MLLYAWESLEILAEIPDEESEGQEEDGDNGELFHGFVLERAYHVEDEVDHVVGGAPHLVKRGGDGDAVVFDVAEVGVGEGRNGDAGDSDAAGFSREAGGGYWVGAVVAEGVYQRDNGLDAAAEDGKFRGKDV